MSSPPLDTPAETPAIAATEYRFAFHGTGGSFFLIFLKNILLTMVTLGIYLAWAKTERRRYVWNNFVFHDQNFRYTGTGKELFKGYLIVVAAYLLFFGVPALIQIVSPTGATIVQYSMAIAVFFAVPFPRRFCALRFGVGVRVKWEMSVDSSQQWRTS